MHRHLMACLAAALLTAGGFSLAADPGEKKSALESDPKGWQDILPGKDLKGWNRVPIPPGSPLKDKSPWSVDAETKTLVCVGVGVHEMLLYDKELTDFIFHVEWRFKKLDDPKARYNSGVYARNSADGKIWHQAQVGNMNVGFLFGDTLPLKDGKPQRVRIDDKAPQRGKGPGEWNTYEITCKGNTMTLWINGAVTTTWKDCPVAKGYVGLEAEGFFIEFRNLKVKPLAP